MSNKAVTDVFDKMPADSYDENNKKHAPTSDNLHYLNSLILKDLPNDAKILCVGVGTGADILALAEKFPQWTFTGIEPASTMIDRCQKLLKEKNLLHRCELFHGYLSDYKSSEQYDAILCLFVFHFVNVEDRKVMISDMHKRLKPNGYLINAEISYDMESPLFPLILEKWATLQTESIATAEKVEKILESFREYLTILPPEQVEKLLTDGGLKTPIQFFQSLLIRAWYSRK